MAEYLVLAIVVGLPIFLGVFFRVSAPHLFFSVMAGELLARYFGEEAELALQTMTGSETLSHNAELLILFLPVLLTSLILKQSISRAKTMLNIFPLVVTGLVFAAFAIPLLPPEFQESINQTFIGREFTRASSALIGFVVMFQLLFLWLLNRNEKFGKKGRKR